MISINYVSILVPIYQFMLYAIFGSYTWHSMLAFHKPIMIFVYNKHQGNILNNYVSITG